MHAKTIFASLLASTALAVAVSPAAAGQDDRARQAIAAAEAKLQTAVSLGAGLQAPYDTAEARDALFVAKERLNLGKEKQAIAAAVHAEDLAEIAIGKQQAQKALETARAQDSAVAAQAQAAASQQQAADANARAAAAERSAIASAADAAAARDAAAQAGAAAHVETTVTTEPVGAYSSRKTTVTRKTTTTPSGASATSVTTTTQVAP